MRCDVANANRYVPTEREKAFQSTIENQKYEREIINGLTPFLKDKAPSDIKNFYSADELAALAKLKDTDRDVEARMPVKMTRHFFEMAQTSKPLQRLVKASPDETLNLAGSEDPGLPNWVDTTGHRRGTLLWRFASGDDVPEAPRVRVVQTSSLR